MNQFENQSLCKPLWRYGLFAIDSELLVESAVSLRQQALNIRGHQVPWSEIDQVIVVGAGKAGAGMVRGLLKLWARAKCPTPLRGLVNVPDNCVEKLDQIENGFAHGIRLHGGRPAGVNEPTAAGVEGARQMLDLVQSAGSRDLVVCLVSGGGSALAPLPVDDVSLEAKQAMTRFLSRSGCNINDLNCVRSAISQIKGGGLVRGFGGHSLHSLIISDVLGNPLQTIASGMTVSQSINYSRALEVLKQYDQQQSNVDPLIYHSIERQIQSQLLQTETQLQSETQSNVFNHIIGDNSSCVESIARMAKQLGYVVDSQSAQEDEGNVELVADQLFQTLQERLASGGMARPYCLISGGEPTVVVTNPDGKGGRNQHLALLMLDKLMSASLPDSVDIEFVSLGTDGEDGPTDAAGALIGRETIEKCRQLNLDPRQAIDSNNAYPFFDQLGALIKTGPTHTNVCDIRILAIQPSP